MSHFFNCLSHRDDRDEDQTSKTSSNSTPSSHNYEVFLSFNGEDTRYGFTDHLYHRLIDRGITVFRDNEELHAGEKIDQLLEAIKASKILIPIISLNYASSIWCLKELLQILECKKSSSRLVLPIFYHVKPSDVREQKGKFGDKFWLCMRKYDLDGKLVQELENALAEVTSLKGWESDRTADGHEGELVKLIVTRIFNELRKAVLVVPDFLVGVVDHVKEIMKRIDAIPSNDAKIIGIHGMGGIGKTTLAKVLYNALSNNFDCCSFVPNIREASRNKGMEALQKQVISDILIGQLPREISHVDDGITIIEKSFKGKRLLLLLDDVENEDQLNKLASKNNWFEPGSLIIITTRNKNVIVEPVVDLSYELNELNQVDSYKLFCNHAFGRDAPCPKDWETIARDIISTTGGLPLAVEIIGSLLCRKDVDIWRETLERLRKIPNDTVRKKLKISYDALEYRQQQIFLDIACLPIGDELDFASYMWDSCGFYPKLGIQALISLSLIKIGYKNRPIMHDQLRDLGREIVREEGQRTIGMYSRLWFKDEVIEVLEGKKGTTEVQALTFKYREIPAIHCTSQQFEGMTNLRFLHMEYVHLTGDFENLFSNLRWLRWHIVDTIRNKFDIMGINFNPIKLVVLDLRMSNITEHWKVWSQMKNLKVLKLEFCHDLTTTPDFSVLMELEVLVLTWCSKLRKIHPSVSKLSKTLKVLHVLGCFGLEELPVQVGKMEELGHLIIDRTGIKEIPISKGYMTKLETLSACDCKKLSFIPDSIGKLKFLTKLDLRNTGITQLPDSIGELYNLESLYMGSTPIKSLPISIEMLSKMQLLDLEECKELETLSNLPCSLTSLHFNGNSMETLPDISNLTNLKYLLYKDVFERRNRVLNLGNLNHLETLKILYSDLYEWSYWIDLDEAPEDVNLLLQLPSGLEELLVHGCQTLRTLPDLSNLKNLSRLTLKDCSELNGLGGVESLTHLRIERCRKLSKLSSMGTGVMDLRLESLDTLQSMPHHSTAKKMEELEIRKCHNQAEIQGLKNVEGLQTLEINGCCSLERINVLSHFRTLTTLELCDCEKLSDVQGIEKLTSLTKLSFYGCHPEFKFPDLSKLKNLKELIIRDERLTEIQGLQELKSLENLNISGCKSLQYLSDLSESTNLRKLNAMDCENLTEIRWLESLTSLRKLDVRGCTAIRNLPDLSNVDIKSDPFEEDEEGGIPLPKCFPISQKLRSPLSLFKRKEKGQIPQVKSSF